MVVTHSQPTAPQQIMSKFHLDTQYHILHKGSTILGDLTLCFPTLFGSTCEVTLTDMGKVNINETKPNKEATWLFLVTYCYIANNFDQICLSLTITQHKVSRYNLICGHGSNASVISQANLKTKYAVCIQLKWYCIHQTCPLSHEFYLEYHTFYNGLL